MLPIIPIAIIVWSKQDINCFIFVCFADIWKANFGLLSALTLTYSGQKTDWVWPSRWRVEVFIGPYGWCTQIPLKKKIQGNYTHTGKSLACKQWELYHCYENDPFTKRLTLQKHPMLFKSNPVKKNLDAFCNCAKCFKDSSFRSVHLCMFLYVFYNQLMAK